MSAEPVRGSSPGVPRPLRVALSLVGNDIVDLDEPGNRESFERAGYVERVCSLAEQRALEGAQDPVRLFWSFFAAKEASYKLLTKLGEAPGLSHRRIEVAGDLSVSRYKEREMTLAVAHADGWVHALSCIGPTEPRFEVCEVAAHARASAAGRELACRMGAEALGVSGALLSVERRPSASSFDGFEPPRLCENGVPTGLDVSLSHDGRFVAAALALGSVSGRA